MITYSLRACLVQLQLLYLASGVRSRVELWSCPTLIHFMRELHPISLLVWWSWNCLAELQLQEGWSWSWSCAKQAFNSKNSCVVLFLAGRAGGARWPRGQLPPLVSLICSNIYIICIYYIYICICIYVYIYTYVYICFYKYILMHKNIYTYRNFVYAYRNFVYAYRKFT